MPDADYGAKKSDLEQRIRALGPGVIPFWTRSFREDHEDPQLLRWRDMYPLLLEAGELITLGDEAFRRAFGGYQIVMPGERATAHRHTASAVRFVVQGDGLGYTTSNGEQMFMEPGDFLVQPSMTWHDHGNMGEEPVVWMDFLDSTLIAPLEAGFHEDWADGNLQPVIHPEGYHSMLYGSVRPARLIGARIDSPQDSPPVTYKFKDTLRVLEHMAEEEEHDPHAGVLLEYANPVSGGHTLPTMCARIQMLRPGESTRPLRHTGFIRFDVVRGHGVTTVDLDDPTDLSWEERDIVRVPHWRWYKHRNTSQTEPAILFSISFSPLAEALGFYREEKA
jgi:gentisate 1,2-dioxygenase